MKVLAPNGPKSYYQNVTKIEAFVENINIYVAKKIYIEKTK